MVSTSTTTHRSQAASNRDQSTVPRGVVVPDVPPVAPAVVVPDVAPVDPAVVVPDVPPVEPAVVVPDVARDVDAGGEVGGTERGAGEEAGVSGALSPGPAGWSLCTGPA
ncbi:hypothetical protein CXF45_03895 [Corynebacterium bovis]|uniref:hypothetical protein n=1 Tax=Corynebacterium bovis TaxID=36808 RepID=UPI000F64E04C|nr:hypothetical protein [Corynebacterium bovis]QQC47990.1 hypothetical protein I6I09_03485 [Corynebacterium bovis]RRO82009.1 hypothetical protein CXF38_02165 [Corynebacterium bovis]RRO85038.1 hypothetical protein CXF37_01070 [Corynebacterium bovis]RRO91382.1 hypothetical protein CXF45_03895 [Corynebacterium bovis]